METIDYYSQGVASRTAYGVGRGARAVQVAAQRISPLKAAAAVAVAWGAIAGLTNYRRCKKGKLTKKEALAVTANESVGMGLAAGIGLFADALVKTYVFTAASTSVVPFAVAVAVTGTTKITWDCMTGKNMMWCGRSKTPVAARNEA